MCCGFIFDEIVCLVKLAFPTMLFNTLEIMLLVIYIMCVVVDEEEVSGW